MRLLSIRLRLLLLFLFLTVRPACAVADEFPEPLNSERTAGEPMSAAEAAAAFEVPDGFHVTVFAAEPEVQNPIAVSWDGRGRMWIAENYTYAERPVKFDLGLRDRIVIFDDADGDGVADDRRVFSESLQRLTSLEVGLGGVWVMCPPQLLFIPDRDRDDVPDGPAEVVLDGFEVPPENYHNFANGLRFGPDGWLYGRCGASAPGEVGAPRTPADDRVPLRGSMWRYDPRSGTFEALSHGTTNPWGHDWNAAGELFFVNTVNGHLWHGIAGAHLVRPHTLDPNRYVYQSIDMHADHWHFDTSGEWHEFRDGAANAYGGGHAHSGTIIYQGDNWPEEYRGRLLTLNLHGRRINQELLERSGSGYVAHHGPDMLVSADPFFRGIELTYGPDGGVFVLDWSDTGECHEGTGVHRQSGRIFKVTYGTPAPRRVDLAELARQALIDLLRHPNQWYVRQARLELRRRVTDMAERDAIVDALRSAHRQTTAAGDELERLWTLHTLGASDRATLLRLLADDDEHVRLWALRLLTDHLPLDDIFSRRRSEPSASEVLVAEVAALAERESSPLVRLGIASVLQRLPVADRAEVALRLVTRSEDADDHNLPLMVWYGLIPVAQDDPQSLVRVAAEHCWPVVRTSIARRLSEDIESNPAPINALVALAAEAEDAFVADLLAGMSAALEGWRKAPQPAAWPKLVASLDSRANSELQSRAAELSVVFGDGRAVEELRQMALDRQSPLPLRSKALETLIEARPNDLRAICERLLEERFLNTIAARGLSQFNDARIAEKLVASYARFHPSERGAVIDTLASRVSFAHAALDAVAAGKIARQDITPFHARIIGSFGDSELTKKLHEVWGNVRSADREKREQIAALHSRLTEDALTAADLSRGRALFATVCGNCHRLYGVGGGIGPDLTGSGRHNLDYLLENIVDPSAVVTADHRTSVVLLTDGRVLNGVVVGRNEQTLKLQTMQTVETIPTDEIEGVRLTDASLMPDGLLQTLDEAQIRDLIAYLKHPTQIALPSEPR